MLPEASSVQVGKELKRDVKGRRIPVINYFALDGFELASVVTEINLFHGFGYPQHA